eukprot:g8815.t1
MVEQEEQELLLRLLQAALRALYPREDEAFFSTAKPRRASRPNAFDQYQCLAAPTLFKKYPPARLSLPKEDHPDQEAETPHRLGLSLSRRLLRTPWLHRVDVLSDGRLVLTTRRWLLLQHRTADRLQCPHCGMFCQADKGLRTHCQLKHLLSFETASQAVQEALSEVRAGSSDAPSASSSADQLADPNNNSNKKSKSNSHTASSSANTARGSLPEALWLAQQGRLQELKDMVADGWPVVSVRDRHASSALHWAAGMGHVDVVRFLLEQRADALQTQQQDGRHAMHWAARNGHLPVVRLLVEEAGVPLDAPTKDGTTPLHWAVWQGRLDVAQWLYSKGASVHLQNRHGCNAMHWAAQTSSVPMLAWLSSLDSTGRELRVFNRNGRSTLHKAAALGHREVCQWLIEQKGLGKRYMLEDDEGHTPAELARIQGHNALAAYLQEAARVARATERLLGSEVLELEPGVSGESGELQQSAESNDPGDAVTRTGLAAAAALHSQELHNGQLDNGQATLDGQAKQHNAQATLDGQPKQHNAQAMPVGQAKEATLDSQAKHYNIPATPVGRAKQHNVQATSVDHQAKRHNVPATLDKQHNILATLDCQAKQQNLEAIPVGRAKGAPYSRDTRQPGQTAQCSRTWLRKAQLETMPLPQNYCNDPAA